MTRLIRQTLVDQLRAQLLASRTFFDWVVKEWALSPREVARWELGMDGSLVTVPVRVYGRLVDVRLVDPAGVAPTTSWSPRDAGRRAWPLEGVDDASEVWLTEDEPDALCLRALGLTALTLTADWTQWGPSDVRRWSKLTKNRRVRFLLSDTRFARRRARELDSAAEEIRVLSLDLPVRRRARAAVSLLGWGLAEFLGLAARTRPLGIS